jgi:hypothetical protein
MRACREEHGEFGAAAGRTSAAPPIDHPDRRLDLQPGPKRCGPTLDLLGTASQLPRPEDLDGLDIGFLAPAAGSMFGQRTASRPLGVAEGRDTLGP